MQNQTNKNISVQILKLLLTVFLILLLIVITDVSKFWETVKQFNLLMFLLALALNYLGILISCMRWNAIIKAQTGKSMKLQELFKLYLIGSFTNNFLPTSYGGDLVRGQYYPGSKREAYASIFWERAIGFIVIIFFGLFASLLVDIPLSLRAGSISLFLILLLIFTAPFFLQNKVIRVIETIWPLKFLPGIRSKLINFVKTLSHFEDLKSNLLVIILHAVGFALVTIIIYYILFKGVGVDISVIAVTFSVSVLKFVTLIPLTINSIGLKEFADVSLYSNFGVAIEQVLTVSILVRIVVIISSLPGAVFLNKR